MELSLPIYLDHNATTPVDPVVLDAMLPFFTENFGNPSSVTHVHGARAARALDSARQVVADAIGAEPDEIIFTGSCTEANNLAVLGIAAAYPDRQHFVTSNIEHPAVQECFRVLESRGARVTYVPVDEMGRVEPDRVARVIAADTLLVSVMGANNEVGTIQPLREIGHLCAARGVFFHSDCAQLAAYHAPNVVHDGLHLVALSAHKLYGPKGVGALYVRSRRPRVRLKSLSFGGGQERGLRSGTVALPLTVGMAAALKLATDSAVAECERLRGLMKRAFQIVQAQHPDVVLNGDPQDRLPNNLSMSIPQVEPYALIRTLRDTVSFSASSACATQEVKTSHVLSAMYGETDWRARNAFRLGFGRATTIDAAEVAARAIAEEGSRLLQFRSSAKSLREEG